MQEAAPIMTLNSSSEAIRPTAVTKSLWLRGFSVTSWHPRHLPQESANGTYPNYVVIRVTYGVFVDSAGAFQVYFKTKLQILCCM